MFFVTIGKEGLWVRCPGCRSAAWETQNNVLTLFVADFASACRSTFHPPCTFEYNAHPMDSITSGESSNRSCTGLFLSSFVFVTLFFFHSWMFFLAPFPWLCSPSVFFFFNSHPPRTWILDDPALVSLSTHPLILSSFSFDHVFLCPNPPIPIVLHPFHYLVYPPHSVRLSLGELCRTDFCFSYFRHPYEHVR